MGISVMSLKLFGINQTQAERQTKLKEGNQFQNKWLSTCICLKNGANVIKINKINL